MSARLTTPLRIYEPNIIHNPLTWMGIWTPQGWRVHEKRWGRAERRTTYLSGDGERTFFPEALIDQRTKRVEWQDDLHLSDDPLTDGGIYPCDPRVEYPVGRPRWAISHTLLCYPVADHTLNTQEYTWDMVSGDVRTHFRKHVALESARTDSITGTSVRVQRTPISTLIEGNVRYDIPNSAVRGVWDNPQKSGTNYYAKRECRVIAMSNGVYATTPRSPVTQCHGVYAVGSEDRNELVFDSGTGKCRDLDQLVDRLKIPFDLPRLGQLRYPTKLVESCIYGRPIATLASLTGVISPAHIAQLRQRMGARFEPGSVGYSAQNYFDANGGSSGYAPAFDLNGNGVIDEEDAQILQDNLGREVRYNLYLDAYFGANWVSTSCCLDAEHRPGAPLIVDYEYGGGYDSNTGVIELLESPGPNQNVWVEYSYDAPAEAGHDNIALHLYREID